MALARPSLHLTLYILAFLCIRGSNCNCFLPNGTDVNRLFDLDGDVWVPCSTAGDDSMCCRTNVTKGADTCVSNGLCHSNGGPMLWRESCTDPTWTSPACLQLCVAAGRKVQNSTSARWPNGTSFQDANVAVTECNDGSFCCNRGNTDCCAKGNGLFVVDGKVQSSTGTPTASLPNASSTPKGSDASHVGGRTGGNVGAIAGGVVGGIIALVAVVGGVVHRLRRRKGAAAPLNSEMTHELNSTQRLEASGEGLETYKYAKHGAVTPQQQQGLVEVPGIHEIDNSSEI
ncbi:uncharacterized protein PV09_05395 [Verruconis gallopava]|uniref:Mid2 domain-containing protein n=1 Tax=Verruconis gallopava TaxID=253628 RepID=A0A0D1YRE1_9PEZI|nr:uncharacterized protein PV09_05395 [Verruconis gallopava]KIW03167.1 hypothetical protein PV09_05395 [Verruconis gallopava]